MKADLPRPGALSSVLLGNLTNAPLRNRFCTPSDAFFFYSRRCLQAYGPPPTTHVYHTSFFLILQFKYVFTKLSTTNTSLTHGRPGRWVVTDFGTPSVLKWEASNPLQELSAERDVLIRIIVAGIAGVDNIIRAGGYPEPKASQPGFTPGYDVVGEVAAIHESISKECGLTIRDCVTSMCKYGGHATHIVLSYEDAIIIRPDDDMLKICTLPLNYMTSWGMLKHIGVHLPPGSSIVLGSASGGLGTVVAQLNKAFNMGIRIIGTCSPYTFDYVRSLGVEPIDRNAPDLVDQVGKLTNGQGVDVAYDGVCSEDSVKSFLAATKKDFGKAVVFGVSHSDKKCRWGNKR